MRLHVSWDPFCYRSSPATLLKVFVAGTCKFSSFRSIVDFKKLLVSVSVSRSLCAVLLAGGEEDERQPTVGDVG